MALTALPDGFVEEGRGRVRLAARRDALAPLVAAGALEDVGPERWGRRVAEVGGGREPIPVVRIDGLERPVLVKRLRRGGLLRRILPDARSPDRAYRELLVADHLTRNGVLCLPLLAVRLRFVSLSVPRCSIWCLVEYVEGGEDLDAFLARRPSPRRRRFVLREAGDTVRRMHEAGYAHPDLNLRNLLVLPSGRVALLDLGAGLVGARIGEEARVGQLARLARSAVKRGRLAEGRGLRDASRFLAGYDGEARGVWLRRVASRVRASLVLHRVAWRLLG